MTIPKEFIDNLISRTVLSEIVNNYVKLTRKGNRYSGLCPFHSEKTPSFYVNDTDGFFYCFGCGSGGDVISFLRKMDGSDFLETIKKLSEIVGIDFPEKENNNFINISKNNNYISILSDASFYFQNKFKNNNIVNSFIKKRKIKQSTILKYKIGYAPSHGLLNFLLKKGHKKSDLKILGLTSKSISDDSYYDYFRNRIIFPIENIKGEIIAFGGRSLDGKMPKYLNSPDTPTFNKKSVLYGYNQAKLDIKNGMKLVIVEGYIDVISVAATGIVTAVAPLGTAITENQIQQIWKLDKDPILLFDGDSPGLEASRRVIERILPILENNLSMRIGFLPKDKDPDDLINENGINNFREILEKSKSLMQSLWDLNEVFFNIHETNSNPSLNAQFWSYLRKTISTIKNIETKSAYKDELERRINIMRSNTRNSNILNFKKRPKTGKIIKEKAILSLLILFPSLFNDKEEELISTILSNLELENLKKEIFKFYFDYPNCSSSDIRNYLDNAGFSNVLRSIFNNDMEKRIGHELDKFSLEKAKIKFDELLKLYKL